MKILVVGASGGIGLAILKSSLTHYPDAQILGTYYTKKLDFEHPRLEWIQLDATDEKAIESLSKKVCALDILINAVGVLHTHKQQPEKSLKRFEEAFFSTNISLNTLPSILLAKHFERALSSPKNNTFFVACSARIGSIKDNKAGGWLSYRVSKAALNMAIKTISIEWRRKLPNCCALLFHPGTTDTELSKPFQKNLAEGQLHSSSYTAESLLEIIRHSTPADSGKFISFDGAEIEW